MSRGIGAFDVVPWGPQQPLRVQEPLRDRNQLQAQQGSDPHGAALLGRMERYSKLYFLFYFTFIPAYSGFKANPVAMTGLTAQQHRAANLSAAGSELCYTVMVWLK